MKTQEQLGAVHLRIEGLDKKRFKKLVEGHNVTGERRICDELKDTCIGVEYDFIENSFFIGKYQWVSTDSVDKNSRLITLDELEQLLGKERTPEVIQAEIDALQSELNELTKVKVGDVVLASGDIIGVVNAVNVSHYPYSIGSDWYSTAIKIDPNKTVKEILGL